MAVPKIEEPEVAVVAPIPSTHVIPPLQQVNRLQPTPRNFQPNDDVSSPLFSPIIPSINQRILYHFRPNTSASSDILIERLHSRCVQI